MTESKEMKSKDFDKVFISYSSKDEEFVLLLSKKLKEKRITTWFAPWSIKTGQDYTEEIMPAIRSCELFVLIMSSASIGKNSDDGGSKYVRREIKSADDEDRKFAPIQIDKTLERDRIDRLDFITKSYQSFDVTELPTLGEKIEVAANEIEDILGGKSNAPIARQKEILNEAESFLVEGNWNAALLLLKKQELW